jgi:hypothetical protein
VMTNTDDLRRYLSRLLGWTNTSAIENALRSLDLAREHRAQLVLCGAGDLVPIAYNLHRRAFGADTPFILCDPRRGNTPATVRAPANLVDVDAAFAAAAGGSLCIRRRRLPDHFTALVERLRRSPEVQYICLEESSLQWLVRPGPIEIPSLLERRCDIPRIVDECMLDVVSELAWASPLTEQDRAWLIASASASTFSELEKSTVRVIALRSSDNLSQAAARLGMAAVSLSRWKARRRLPAPLSTTARAA